MTGAVFLSGGGGAEDSVPLDTAFASAVGSGPLWYWPIALEPVRHPSCLDWLAGVFGPLGVTEIDMWDGGNPTAPTADSHSVFGTTAVCTSAAETRTACSISCAATVFCRV